MNQQPAIISTSQNTYARISTFVRTNLIGTITATVTGSILIAGVSTFNVWSIYNNYESTVSKEFKLHKASDDLRYQEELANYQQQLLMSIVFAGATLPLLIGGWVMILLAVRDYIQDRQATEASLIDSQSNLVEANTLVEELGIRALYEEEVRSESDLLQADVAQLLDVVSAIEAGDLTVQANVSERVTGLVSDTLNRSIESLDRIIGVVVSTTRTVSQDANELEQITIETAKQAQAQNTEVRAVQSLMNTINSLTADSRQQAIETDVAMKLAQSAVIAGQQAIDDTTDGIETLQEGTNRIVKRSELLSEFVDLAAQFSKDQKRVAALTRVLALNASTISARAIREQNPEQFASLAREFDIIARQVSTLATDTNISLATLQQRTDRVQTVTSGLTQDITEIEELVAKFTTEVNKSRTAFENIQTVTNQVSQIGEKANESSQDIVRVVNDTLIAIESIARAAQSTEASSTITREQVQSMGNLSRRLLEMVEFFKLTEAPEQSGDLSRELQFSVHS